MMKNSNKKTQFRTGSEPQQGDSGAPVLDIQNPATSLQLFFMIQTLMSLRHSSFYF